MIIDSVFENNLQFSAKGKIPFAGNAATDPKSKRRGEAGLIKILYPDR